MSSEQILIPDIGDFDSVDVIEVLVNIGDSIEYDMPLITVESDKASMDIPAPKDGVIKDLKINVYVVLGLTFACRYYFNFTFSCCNFYYCWFFIDTYWLLL